MTARALVRSSIASHYDSSELVGMAISRTSTRAASAADDLRVEPQSLIGISSVVERLCMVLRDTAAITRCCYISEDHA